MGAKGLMNAKQRKRLNEFYADMTTAEARREMAVQTLKGAQNDLQAKTLRFQAAVEFIAGAGATWTHSAEEGVQIVEASAEPAAVATNGASHEAPVVLLPNRATRRKAGKELGL
jgi:hypothetical protein